MRNHNARITSTIKNRFFIILLIIGMCLGSYIVYLKSILPECIYIYKKELNTVNLKVPVSGKVYDNDKLLADLNLNEDVSIISDNLGDYSVEYRLFGLVYLNSAKIKVVERKSVLVGGFQAGIYLKSKGLLVVNKEKITTINKDQVIPCEMIKSGDYIISINGTYVKDKYDFSKMIEESDGEAVKLTVLREDKELSFDVYPVCDITGKYKLGLWIKDDASGIGTVTCIDEDNMFYALGHGVSDSDTGKNIKIKQGYLYNTDILGINKGQEGKPGELIGVINYKKENVIGDIYSNSDCGISGEINIEDITDYKLEAMEIETGINIKKGKAYIRMYKNNSFKDYEIYITDVDYNKDKTFTFEVKSKELIELTNGIVQGMSGCPVIQNNHLIGAVTHVFIDNPRKGYGIFIEEMINRD